MAGAVEIPSLKGEITILFGGHLDPGEGRDPHQGSQGGLQSE